MLLRLGLELADRLVAALPGPVAYALADVAGRAWYRFAPARRRLVAANLGRVCAATGRPTGGAAFRRMVQRAFVEHARYYLELLRTPHYRRDRIEHHVTVREWREHEATMRAGPTVLVSPHVGNFEPMGVFFAAHGLPLTAPVEEIRPPELFEFLRAHRGGGGVSVVPLSKARRPMIAALRRGEAVGLIADRDLAGDGQPVTLFGHATTLPVGPATLVTLSGASFVTGCCLRVAPDRFEGFGERIEYELTGDRRRDVAELTRRMGERFERLIGEAPEQWWGAFQPIWPDLEA